MNLRNEHAPERLTVLLFDVTNESTLESLAEESAEEAKRPQYRYPEMLGHHN